MATEKSITHTITKNLDRYNIFWLKLHGSPMQRRGMPDLLVIKEGIPYFFEVKSSGGKPTELQWHRIRQIRASGAKAWIVHSWDDVKRFLGL